MLDKKVKFFSAPAGRAQAAARFGGAGDRKPAVGRDWRLTSVTRYFCAAAHDDIAFRDRVIEEYMEQKHRAIVVSDGVDMGLVLTHCLDARQRIRTRHFLLWGLIAFSLLLAAILGPEDAILAAIVYVSLAWAILFWSLWSEHRLVVNNFLKSNFNPYCVTYQPDDKAREAIESVTAAQQNRAVVYSGFTPFVGAGVALDGWSFVVDTQKACQDLGPQRAVPFDARDLYGAIDECLNGINWQNAAVEDRVFVHGSDVTGDSRLLPDPTERPPAITDPSLIDSYVDAASNSVRHYKHFRLVEWDGEMILSLFIRVTKPGRDLFVEANYFLLTPLRESFHKLDKINPRRVWKQGLTTAFEALALTVVWPLSALQILGAVEKWRERREIRARIQEDATFDRGAVSSIREMYASNQYQRYFQKLDKEMYYKVLDRHVLDAIVDFLNDRNIDTSDLKQKQQYIMNAGVIVSGGGSVINQGAMSVGEGSRAKAAVAAGGKK